MCEYAARLFTSISAAEGDIAHWHKRLETVAPVVSEVRSLKTSGVFLALPAILIIGFIAALFCLVALVPGTLVTIAGIKLLAVIMPASPKGLFGFIWWLFLYFMLFILPVLFTIAGGGSTGIVVIKRTLLHFCQKHIGYRLLSSAIWATTALLTGAFLGILGFQLSDGDYLNLNSLTWNPFVWWPVWQLSTAFMIYLAMFYAWRLLPIRYCPSCGDELFAWRGMRSVIEGVPLSLGQAEKLSESLRYGGFGEGLPRKNVSKVIELCERGAIIQFWSCRRCGCGLLEGVASIHNVAREGTGRVFYKDRHRKARWRFLSALLSHQQAEDVEAKYPCLRNDGSQ